MSCAAFHRACRLKNAYISLTGNAAKHAVTGSRRGSSRVAGSRNYPQRPLRPLKAAKCRLILYEAKKLKQKAPVGTS